MTRANGPADDTNAEPDDGRYVYDALDRRDTKVKNGVKLEYSYVGLSEALSRTDGPNGQRKSWDYDSATQRLGQTTVAQTGATASFRSYGLDANGSVEQLEDPNGTVASNETYAYDPYGRQETTEGSLTPEARGNPFRFEGFWYDGEVETYDMRARPYRPDIASFLSPDRFEDATGDLNLQTDPLTNNRYAFAGGNPVDRIEFDGHMQTVPGGGGRRGKVKEQQPHSKTYTPEYNESDLQGRPNGPTPDKQTLRSRAREDQIVASEGHVRPVSAVPACNAHTVRDVGWHGDCVAFGNSDEIDRQTEKWFWRIAPNFIPTGALAGMTGKVAVRLAQAARARRAAKAGRGAIELPAFTSSTVDEALASAGRLTKGGQIQEGARAIAKKQGQGAGPFAGLPQTQAQADAIIRDVLSNPTHVFRGDRVMDAYNAAGQGVRLRRGDRSFVGFLDIARRTQ
jgi:RHS repeat-associated protein